MVSLVRLTQPKGTEQKEDIMMNQIFEETYAKDTAILASYHAADQAEDLAGIEKARAEHDALLERIREEGSDFEMLYGLYCRAREIGNALIDIREPHEYNDAAKLIASLRKYGIEEFTFSSGWSSAIESAWEFTQQGCKLEGLVEVNDRIKSFGRKDYDKRHALLFRV